MQLQATGARRSLINYLLDIGVLLAFLIALNPHATGEPIHEWLGIAFGVAIITHLLLHWQWIVTVTRRQFGRIGGKTRINYIVNLLFFIAIVVVLFTGIMISKIVVPSLGISLGQSFIWKKVHSLATDAALILLGVHLALHWRWVLHTTRKLLPSRRRDSSMAATGSANLSVQEGS